MKLITCNERQHAGPILDIFNDAILTSTALYDYKTRHIESMTPWFTSKLANNFPVIGLEDERGTATRIRQLWHISRLASI